MSRLIARTPSMRAKLNLLLAAINDGGNAAQPHLQAVAAGKTNWRSPSLEAGIDAHRFIVLADGDVAHRRVDIVVTQGGEQLVDATYGRARSLATSGSIWRIRASTSR